MCDITLDPATYADDGRRCIHCYTDHALEWNEDEFGDCVCDECAASIAEDIRKAEQEIADAEQAEDDLLHDAQEASWHHMGPMPYSNATCRGMLI